MTTLSETKMPSLKDKILAEEAKVKAKAEVEAKPKKKARKKKDE